MATFWKLIAYSTNEPFDQNSQHQLCSCCRNQLYMIFLAAVVVSTSGVKCMVDKRQTVFLAFGWYFTNIAPLHLCQKNLLKFTHPCCGSIITFGRSRRFFFVVPTKQSFACCSFSANGNDVKKLLQQIIYPLPLICSVSFTTTDSSSSTLPRCSFSSAPQYGVVFATYFDLTSTKTQNFIPYLSGILGMKVIKE